MHHSTVHDVCCLSLVPCITPQCMMSAANPVLTMHTVPACVLRVSVWCSHRIDFLARALFVKLLSVIKVLVYVCEVCVSAVSRRASVTHRLFGRRCLLDVSGGVQCTLCAC
jgi:hypothetical protein